MNIRAVFYTQRVYEATEYKERRDVIDQRLPKLINECGFLPIGMPNDVDIAKKIVSNIACDGIIFSGGNTLCEYGGDAPERDTMERWLLEYAIQNNIPVLGICRGMQFILNYFGVKLHNITGHVGQYHSVDGLLIRDSVNSYHNMAADKLDDGCEKFHILSVDPDGVVEAIKHKKCPIAGIMWHPERETPFNEADCNIIKTFFNTKGEQLK